MNISRKLALIVFVIIVGGIGTAYAGMTTQINLNATQTNVNGNFQVNGDTTLGDSSGMSLQASDAGIDIRNSGTGTFTFGPTTSIGRDTVGNPVLEIGDDLLIRGDAGANLLTVDRTGEFLILGDGPTRNHIFISPTGTIIIDGPTEITGKLTATGGVDPPFVSFSAQTHQGIRALAPDLNPTEEVMIFWNTDSKQMEVYVVAEDKFYSMPLQEIVE